MENKSVTLAAQVLAPAVSEIRSLLEASRKNVAQQVNQELLSTYWKIGEVIVRYEQNDSIRAAYGEKTLLQLSKALTKELGKGFSRSNVYNMRQFYLSYPIFQSVTGKLSWTHYCELLSISDREKRSFYEKEAANSGWSVREMKRQIEDFLLELGRGFMFVGTQQRVTVNNTHYYVDMVFYNKILHAYVLIELKTTKLTPEAAGQINMYLNYYAAEVNDPEDNPPIGIILCTDKDSVAAEYALGGLSNQIFASRYVLYMPNKEQLIGQVEEVLKRWHSHEDE